MEVKLLKFLLYNMTIFYSKDFMKNYNLKNDTMIEIEIQRVSDYRIHPRDSKKTQMKGLLL